MVQGYYTLQEAAKFLEISVEELKRMAQKGQIRSFQDRGTLRFRIQDIQELARVRGGTSDPELLLGDASLPPAPKSTTPPSSGSRKSQQQPGKTALKQNVPEVFDFEFDNENVNIGADVLGPPSSSKSRPTSSKSVKKTPGTHTPVGSDSDVRLVADGSDVSFNVTKDSDVKRGDSEVKIPSEVLKPRSSVPSSLGGKRSSQVSLGSGVQQPPKTSLSGKHSPRPGSGPQPIDSGVRLVPMDDDSDVKLLGASDEVSLGEKLPPSVRGDSNVRLERVPYPSPSGLDVGSMTEEINLDEEIRRQEESEKNKAPRKLKPKSEMKFPTASPFELSESEMKMPSELLDDSGPKTPMQLRKGDSDSSDFDLVAPTHQEDSSDFDLQPSGESSSPVDLTEDSDFSLEVADDQQHVLGDGPAGELTGSTSGISLENPGDSGISLEDASASTHADEAMDFDLSLEVEDTPKSVRSSAVSDSSDFNLKIGDTPRPVQSQPAMDSDSEFELSLDSSPAEQGAQEIQDSDSDIDLSLEVDGDASGTSQGDDDSFEVNLGSGKIQQPKPDSDSEFELTLDDSGNLGALEDESAPQVKSKVAAADEEQDIFETDFEVPALDASSDDGAVADSELESSDFDLALDDSELAAEEESGSQVVALDEEDSEALVDSDSDTAVVDDAEVEEDSSDFGDLDQDVQVDADEEGGVAAAPGETRTVTKVKLVPAAPWGVMPVVFMLPCVVIMFLVGILGYELMQSTTGLRPPGALTLAIADMIGHKITLKQ